MSRLRTRARAILPRGQTLPPEAWARRHRGMLALLWAHVALLPLFSLYRGLPASAAFGWVIPIALAGVAAMLPAASRRARAVAVVFGLLTASTVLVSAWGGQIEGHFHFFVMIAVLALYEDWLPFGLAVAYVVLEHGVLGAISPHSVYNHGGNPWVWALIHGGFVLGAVCASVTTWRLNEEMRLRMDEAHSRERETSDRFELAFETGVTGMALTSVDGRFLSVNQALCDITGYSRKELLATRFEAITHPQDRAANIAQLRALVTGQADRYKAEKRYIHRDGHDVWVHLGVSAVRDEDGSVRYFITQMQDITQRRLFEEELAHRALHDPLTGLPNRALFLDRLSLALARTRRGGGFVAVLFVDLDRFKLVNDAMGHRAGDDVLLEAAQRLEASARAEDTVARFGGDEFTVLCEVTNEHDARKIAARIIDSFDRPFRHGETEFHLSVSAGVRVSDQLANTPDQLLRDADMALYSAKQHGRERFEVFDPGAHTTPNALTIEHELRRAIREGELRVHYQPAISLREGHIVGLEALIRWQHPEHGLIPPGDFIPAAEECGLIIPIGEWVMQTACLQLREWQRQGLLDDSVQMSVNVSGRQLSRPSLRDTVRQALERSGLAPSHLCLEITESAIVHDPETARSNLEQIKRTGVRIALDDFGIGFSSLGQLRDLPPVDVIKVDRSFIAGVGTNAHETAAVKAVLSIANSLELVTVAEGIETAEQLAELRALGCPDGQGYFFMRPMPADELRAEIARANWRTLIDETGERQLAR